MQKREQFFCFVLFISTCRAWLSGGPLSVWYGMTVVRYCKKNENVTIVRQQNTLRLKFFSQTFGSCRDLCWGSGLVPFDTWLRFFVTWCCLRRFCTASNSEINWFFSSFSYSNSSLSANSDMRVSLNAATSDSISPRRSVSWPEPNCLNSTTSHWKTAMNNFFFSYKNSF